MKQGLYEDEDRSGFSVTAYFHMPEEAQAELTLAGLDVIGTFGIEGPGWIAADFEERWQTPEGQHLILESARACESESQLQSLSGHLLAIARK